MKKKRLHLMCDLANNYVTVSRVDSRRSTVNEARRGGKYNIDWRTLQS